MPQPLRCGIGVFAPAITTPGTGCTVRQRGGAGPSCTTCTKLIALLKILALLTPPVSSLTPLTGTLVLLRFTRVWWGRFPAVNPPKETALIPAIGRAPLSP